MPLNIITHGMKAKKVSNEEVAETLARANEEAAIREKHGYQEIWVPIILRREMMEGIGQLPKLEEDMYHVEKDDLFLIPTAEVPITNIHRNEIFPTYKLPLY